MNDSIKWTKSCCAVMSPRLQETGICETLPLKKKNKDLPLFIIFGD
jgi:hypothetical protein